MHSERVKYMTAAIILAGTMVLSGENVFAADTNERCAESGIEDYAALTDGEYFDIGFADVDEGSFLYIRSEAARDSEWVGKIYPGSAVKIDGPIGEWTKVVQGAVSGYAKTEYLKTGERARAQMKMQEQMERQVQQEDAGAKEQMTQQEEAETQEVTGQKVVEFASQFIGNPYVWGGTSLTDGADCSGFVQSVYASFGVNMPRTSGEMRSAGVEVSYEDAVPGDVICYSGHVGIYIGDGQIVNAIDEAHGIGISRAGMMNIITVRRLL